MTIKIEAQDLVGKPFEETESGYIARIWQHETDHLDGVLFIDRLSPECVRALEPSIDTLIEDFTSRQRTGSLDSDERLMSKISEWERKYC